MGIGSCKTILYRADNIYMMLPWVSSPHSQAESYRRRSGEAEAQVWQSQGDPLRRRWRCKAVNQLKWRQWTPRNWTGAEGIAQHERTLHAHKSSRCVFVVCWEYLKNRHKIESVDVFNRSYPCVGQVYNRLEVKASSVTNSKKHQIFVKFQDMILESVILPARRGFWAPER